jgi:hypothetical protein
MEHDSVYEDLEHVFPRIRNQQDNQSEHVIHLGTLYNGYARICTHTHKTASIHVSMNSVRNISELYSYMCPVKFKRIQQENMVICVILCVLDPTGHLSSEWH